MISTLVFIIGSEPCWASIFVRKTAEDGPKRGRVSLQLLILPVGGQMSGGLTEMATHQVKVQKKKLSSCDRRRGR